MDEIRKKKSEKEKITQRLRPTEEYPRIASSRKASAELPTLARPFSSS
jgi:hypothetical protein